MKLSPSLRLPLAFLLLLWSCQEIATAQACADCNMDGAVNILDALKGAQHAAGLIPVTPADLLACDTDLDADVDVIDALRMAQLAAGLPVAITCVPRAPELGEVLVTEIMQNPSAVSDTVGEWFEVLNVTSEMLELEGTVIRDDDCLDIHVVAAAGGSLAVAPGQYRVFGINADPMVNGNVPIDYQYASVILANGADELILVNRFGREITRIEYDGGPRWPDPNGASMNLDPVFTDPTLGVLPGSWCPSTIAWAGADLGSPGAANQSCGAVSSPPHCAIAAFSACASGDVAVNFNLFDADMDPLTVTLESSTDGGTTWTLATPAATSPAPFDVNPATGVTPGTGLFWWNSPVDIGTGFAGILTVRIIVADGTSDSSCTLDYLVDNTGAAPPVTCSIIDPSGGMVPAGGVTLVFDSASGSAAFARVEYSTDGGGSFGLATPASWSPAPYAVNPALATTGAGQRFVWNSLADGVTSGSVQLRVTVTDCSTMAADTTTFDLNATTPRPPGAADLVLSEIHADPDAIQGDANGDGTRDASDDEFVELVNVTCDLLDLANVTLVQDSGLVHTFPAGTILRSGSCIVVFGGGRPTGLFGGNLVQVAATCRLRLDNLGDQIDVLLGGALLESYTYGVEGSMDESLARSLEPASCPPDPGGAMLLHGAAQTAVCTPPPAPLTRYSPGTTLCGAPSW